MSDKIKKSLIILVVILAVLIIAIAAAVLIPKLTDGSEDADGPLITMEAPVKIAFGEGDDITEFILEGDTWLYAEDTSYPIKQNGITRILDALPKLIPTRSIEASDSLSAYGLDPADYTLILTDAEGNTKSLYIGSAVGENECYAKTSDSDSVHIILTSSNIASFLASTLNVMIDAELPPSMGESAIVEMTVEYGGKSASFKQDEEGWFYLLENGEYVVEEDYSAVGSDGESHTVRKYLNDVGDAVPEFKSQGCRGYAPSEAELSEMGFDDALTLTVSKTDGTNMVYHVGGTFTDAAGKEFRYFIVEGNPAVFSMSAETVLPFIELVNVLGR